MSAAGQPVASHSASTANDSARATARSAANVSAIPPNQAAAAAASAMPQRSAGSSSSHHSRGAGSCPSSAAAAAAALRRDKSPSDLEADDENDHDSLNQSETGSGSNLSVCNLACEQQRRYADASATQSQRSVSQTGILHPMKHDYTFLRQPFLESTRSIFHKTHRDFRTSPVFPFLTSSVH